MVFKSGVSYGQIISYTEVNENFTQYVYINVKNGNCKKNAGQFLGNADRSEN